MEATNGANEWRRVQVCDDTGAVIAEEAKPDPAWCERYAKSMKRRFPWCTVTNEPLPGAVALP